MKLTIVYDDEVYNTCPGIPDHGFSCYIETKKDTVLFDTGTNGQILLKNMQLLHKDPSKISKIVISHEHHDHNGGLSHLSAFLKKDTIVYRLNPGLNQKSLLEKQIMEPIHISENIYSTGRLNGTPKDEQSLILKTGKGLVVLTGCSHPRLDYILQKAKKQGNVIGLIGGFHGFSDLKILKSMQFIYPCHCTVRKKEIKAAYPNKSYTCGVGLTVTL